jgi:MoxR-like ATPase
MPLPEPFLVLATQNPTEQQGTYPLPESQLDRFLLRLEIGYPSREEEKAVLRGESRRPDQLRPVLSLEQLREWQADVGSVRFDSDLVDYLMALVEATRTAEGVVLGVSPRGGQALYRAAQASALLDGRDYVVPDDVKGLAVPVFSHRLRLDARASFGMRSAEAAQRVVEKILAEVEVPV